MEQLSPTERNYLPWLVITQLRVCCLVEQDLVDKIGLNF